MYSNSVNAYNLGNFFVTHGDDVTVRTLRLSFFWERGLLSKERGSAQAYSELKGTSQGENYHGEYIAIGEANGKSSTFTMK